jgi:hypothetical protein
MSREDAAQETPQIRFRRRLIRGIRILSIQLALLVLFSILIEGSASVALLFKRLALNTAKPVESEQQYDPLLGWDAAPNRYIPDAYGPGKHIRINGQGLRSDVDVALLAAPSKLRIVCSGDSQTFGMEVGNGQTWCDQLAFKRPDLETLNFAQAGYGIDQAFLRYKRDADKLEHKVHLFAFIQRDLWRMTQDSLNGTPKPWLSVVDGTLVTNNVPVPSSRLPQYWLTRNHYIFEPLAALTLGTKVLSRFRQNDMHQVLRNDEKFAVLANIIGTLDSYSKSKGVFLAFIFMADLGSLKQRDADLSGFLESQLELRKVAYLDLHPVFADLSYRELQRMFDTPNGHYSEAGHAFVADRIWDRVLAGQLMAKQR